MILKDKVAVVTGAAGAIGLAAARALMDDGARVALVDVDALRLDGIARFLRGPLLALPCDVSDAMAVRMAHERVQAELGTVDILVNAAGIASGTKVADTDEATWKRVLATRLDGTFLWSRAVLPGMTAKGWGRIVNAGGLEAKAGVIGAGAADAAAAGAIASFTFALAREVAGSGVTANVIAPAFVRSVAATEQLTDAQRRQLLAAIPAGRFCEPEEFAHAVRFLASPLAGFITGEVIDLNGGVHTD